MDIVVLDKNPIYEGEKYRLKFTFGSNYPIEVRICMAFAIAARIH